MTLYGPNGLPISGAPQQKLLDLGPGTGGRIVFAETATVPFPNGVQVRFSPGAYLFVAEGDFERMVAEAAVRMGKA